MFRSRWRSERGGEVSGGACVLGPGAELLTEKFRTFSGKVRTVAEVRVSQDRIEGIEEQLRLYVDAVTQVLDANRGSWGQGCSSRAGTR